MNSITRVIPHDKKTCPYCIIGSTSRFIIASAIWHFYDFELHPDCMEIAEQLIAQEIEADAQA